MKKKIPFAIGLILPILLVVFVALLSYMPKELLTPKYNFLYATGDYFYTPVIYVVKDGRIVEQARTPIIPPSKRAPAPVEKLYLYDVQRNQAQPISVQDAQKLTLDPHAISPDGFRIVFGSSETTFFPLFLYTGTDYSVRFLAKQSYRKRLNLKLTGQFYDNFYFLGWVINGKT